MIIIIIININNGSNNYYIIESKRVSYICWYILLIHTR